MARPVFHSVEPKKSSMVTPPAREPSLHCHALLEDLKTPAVLERYRTFAQGAIHGAAQHPHWVEAAATTQPHALQLLTIMKGEQPILMMPLEIINLRGARTARSIGGSHANGNFPALKQHFAPADAQWISAIREALRGAGVDLLALDRQARSCEDLENPFLHMKHSDSADISLAVDLTPGFDAIIDRLGRKRRMKKHRSQIRKFEAAGGYRHVEARAQKDVDELLGAFFEQKAKRFAVLGLPDVFAQMQGFFRALYQASLADSPPAFRLHALEVGGKIRAVTGSSYRGGRVICDFNSFADDELVAASPGDFLFALDIEKAARDGFSVFDFSVGDEAYKRLWCDLDARQFDTVLPATAKGQAHAASLRLAASVKRSIKAQPWLWDLVRKLRRKRAAD